MLSQPWPWYVAGPVIGLFVPALLLLGRKEFGISVNFRHLCAAVAPGPDFLRYDWWREGRWNLAFVLGVLLGGAVSAALLGDPNPVAISEATRADLAALGLTRFDGLVPSELVSWTALLTPGGFTAVIVGGFLVGFGSRWAGGCTSGHAISGLANLQLSCLVAVMGFFAGGLLATHFVLPLLL
jgi:uncharacterized membrane protein YedE/YeeE